MKARPGLLVVISGPGGVGKDTVIGKLCQLDPKIRISVSYTTRPRRDYEEDGVHYSFIDEAAFQRLIDRGELMEWNRLAANGSLYGSSRKRVEELEEEGYDVILKIEVHGAEAIRKQRPDGILIFIQPPSMEELLRRREKRGSEDKDEMMKRQKEAAWEMSHAQYYDYVVVNEDVEVAARDILQIVDAERARRAQEAGESAD